MRVCFTVSALCFFFSVLLVTMGKSRAQDAKPSEVKLPEGLRAYVILLDKQGPMAGLIVPGSRVDVIFTPRKATGKPKPQVLVADVLVVAVQTMQPPKGKGEPTRIYTLAVTAAQGMKLNAELPNGSFYFALRKPTDKKAAPSNSDSME